MAQDLQQCVVFLERASDQGHPKALFNLGLMYERGQGVEMDNERARLCYTEAAAQGNVKVRLTGRRTDAGHGVRGNRLDI